MSNLVVFTAAESPDRLALLQESCKAVNITLYSYISTGSFLAVKLVEGVNFLSNLMSLAREEYIMWVDGHDSLILKPEREILARLASLDAAFLMSAEVNCWPDASMADKYPESEPPRFLNAGGFIGTKNAVMRAMHTVIQHAQTGDDMREWTRAYTSKLLPMMQLDRTRTIFANMGDGEPASKVDTCVRHWNGRTPGREDYWRDYAQVRGFGIGRTLYGLPEHRERPEAIPEAMAQRGSPSEVEPGHSIRRDELSNQPGLPSEHDLPTSRTRTPRVRRGRRST